jgi:DNA-binding transcriptional LysR family regulator
VVFRPLKLPAKADYWIAWHRENRSQALHQCIEIVKNQAARPH